MRFYRYYNGGGVRYAFFAVVVAVAAVMATAAARAEQQVVAVFGDSLSSGYQLAADEGFVPALQAILRQKGIEATVVNNAIAGETSGEGLLRVDWLLRKKPDLVIVELGANDMLRALPPALLEDNLNRIIVKIKAANAKVLLAGMLAAANLGDDYGKRFAAVYPRVAATHNVALYPFFLKDVALVERLNLSDGMHPNAEGARVIAANIAPMVISLLEE